MELKYVCDGLPHVVFVWYSCVFVFMFFFAIFFAACSAVQDLSLVVTGSSGKRNSRNVPYTQFFVTSVKDDQGQSSLTFVSLQPVSGPEAEPSQTMVRATARAIPSPPPLTPSYRLERDQSINQSINLYIGFAPENTMTLFDSPHLSETLL